jgi:hypothetical protein
VFCEATIREVVERAVHACEATDLDPDRQWYDGVYAMHDALLRELGMEDG